MHMVAASEAALSTDTPQARTDLFLIIIIPVNCLYDHHKMTDFLQERNRIKTARNVNLNKNQTETEIQRQYFVLCCHSNCVVLPSCCVAEALSCGDGGVSHSGCGEENTQVLDGASQTFSLHLEQTEEKLCYFSLQNPLLLSDV